jgi:hypothetical protein
MANARILFTSFVNRAIPAAERWRERELEIAGFLPEADTTVRGPAGSQALLIVRSGTAQPARSMVRRMTDFRNPSLVWRLVSNNHRELARGIGMFEDFSEARSHAVGVQKSAGELNPVPVRHPSTGAYGWVAWLGIKPVLMGSHWHLTAHDRDRLVGVALSAFAEARLADKPVKHGQRHLNGVPERPSPPVPGAADAAKDPHGTAWAQPSSLLAPAVPHSFIRS